MASFTPLASLPLSAVEVQLSYGGDFTLTPTGDLAIVQDTPYIPAATIQRVLFLIQTNPAIPYTNSQGTSAPDDIFNPTYGSGARLYVGRPTSQANIDAIQRNILNGLASDPFILQIPPPSVLIDVDNPSGTTMVTVNFKTITGQNVTIPDVQLGGSVT
jgi:hypothetical protein